VRVGPPIGLRQGVCVRVGGRRGARQPRAGQFVAPEWLERTRVPVLTPQTATPGTCAAAYTSTTSPAQAPQPAPTALAPRPFQVPSELARRRKALGALTNAYAAALSEGPLTPPARPDQGQGYTLMLEQRLADEQPDFIEFSRVLSGGAAARSPVVACGFGGTMSRPPFGRLSGVPV
jgi:hypothetical protein